MTGASSPERSSVVRASAFTACVLLATACAKAVAPSPPLANVLGKQPTVSLGSCTLQERPNGLTNIVCDEGSWQGALPMFGFMAFFLWIAWTYLKKSSGYRRDLAGVALGLGALFPAGGLAYVGYLLLEDHAFSVDRPRQLVTHEVRVFGTLTRSMQGAPPTARCTTNYASGSKNRRGGWDIKLTSGTEAPRAIGRVGNEADARAVCEHLLPAAGPGPAKESP